MELQFSVSDLHYPLAHLAVPCSTKRLRVFSLRLGAKLVHRSCLLSSSWSSLVSFPWVSNRARDSLSPISFLTVQGRRNAQLSRVPLQVQFWLVKQWKLADVEYRRLDWTACLLARHAQFNRKSSISGFFPGLLVSRRPLVTANEDSGFEVGLSPSLSVVHNSIGLDVTPCSWSYFSTVRSCSLSLSGTCLSPFVINDQFTSTVSLIVGSLSKSLPLVLLRLPWLKRSGESTSRWSAEFYV